MDNKYLYMATIVDRETDKFIVELSASSAENLEEEMGKGKWTDAVKRYEAENSVIEEDQDDHDCHLSEDDGCDHPSHQTDEVLKRMALEE